MSNEFKMCTSCNGSGMIFTGETMCTCFSCGGSGKVKK